MSVWSIRNIHNLTAKKLKSTVFTIKTDIKQMCESAHLEGLERTRAAGIFLYT